MVSYLVSDLVRWASRRIRLGRVFEPVQTAPRRTICEIFRSSDDLRYQSGQLAAPLSFPIAPFQYWILQITGSILPFSKNSSLLQVQYSWVFSSFGKDFFLFLRENFDFFLRFKLIRNFFLSESNELTRNLGRVIRFFTDSSPSS